MVLTLCFGFLANAAAAEEFRLPTRSGERPQTTNSVPHVQINPKVIPELKEALLSRVSKIPGVELRATVISLAGAKGFWLSESLNLLHPEVIVGGREFAHIHPDGSLHAALPVERAKEAVKAGWATPHPWANKRRGWEGFVMIYTPQSKEDADVIFQLIADAYNYITGEEYKATQE